MSRSNLHAIGLGNVSRSLQALHQALLHFQADHVNFNGSPLELFDLATKDRHFAWLKPLRELIVALDERCAQAEPVTDRENADLRRQCRALLDPQTGPLAAHLKNAFQVYPDAIWASQNARNLLREAA